MATLTIATKTTLTSDAGVNFGTTRTTSILNVVDTVEFEKSIGTSVEDILALGAAGSGSIPNLLALIVKNEDVTNFVTLGIKDTGGKTAYFKIPAGNQIILTTDEIDANITGAVFAAFSNADTITAQADTASVIISLQAFGS